MDILTFFGCILVLYIVLKIISLPFRVILKFIINSMVGGIILWLCIFFGIGIAVNTTMILLTGLFGVPGLVLAVILTAIL